MPTTGGHYSYLTTDLSVLQARYEQMADWRYTNLSAPYWRVYLHTRCGCQIRHNAQEVALDSSSIVLIAPNTPFSSGIDRTVAGDRPVGQFYVHFTLGHSLDRLENHVYMGSCPRSLKRILCHLTRDPDRRAAHPADGVAIMQIISAALLLVPRAHWSSPMEDHRIRQAIQRMEDSVLNPPCNAELARAVSMATSSFIRRFTSHTGISPHKYMLKQQLDKACRMLHYTDESIDAIAEACGFQERGYFSRIFTRKRGISPAAFRKLNRVRRDTGQMS